MTLDGRSLLAVAAGLCLALGLVVLALERRLSQPVPGLRLWACANFAVGAAALLHLLQGFCPAWMPALAGNALGMAGRATAVAAILQFDRRRVPVRPLAGLAAAFAVGFAAAYFWPRLGPRGPLMMGGIALFSTWAVAALASGAPPSVSRVVVAVGLCGLALSNLAGLGLRPSLLDAAPTLATPTAAGYVGVTVICDVLCNVGFVLLVTERMHEWVLQLARTDHLTGALSREALVTQAGRDLLRARRQHSTTAAFIVDIDHFKAFNDRGGHAAGDAVLRHVAQHGQSVLRCTDLFARWGGDEFVALLPETDLLTAAAIAERLRAAVGEPAHNLPAGLPPVSVSIGVAALQAGQGDLGTLVAQADAALYNAKGAGRNRTRVADEAQAPGNTSLHLLQGRR